MATTMIPASPEVIEHEETEVMFKEIQECYSADNYIGFDYFLKEECKPISRLHPERSSR